MVRGLKHWALAFLGLLVEGNRLPKKGKSAVDTSRDPGALQYHSCPKGFWVMQGFYCQL